MDFENHLRVVADFDAVEGEAARAFDLEFEVVAVFDVVVGHVLGGHVNVTLGSDDALGHVDRALGTEHGAASGALVIAAGAEGQIDTEIDAIGVGHFDLGVITERPEDADVGDDPLSGTDDGDELFAGELALLIEVFQLGQIRAGAEKRFQIGLGDVHVPG